jgi:multidrug resistance protein MdtO
VFFVININQKFARETSLSVARDRVAGVFLGLMMMWLIFDQLWSAPASVEMKKVFISNLRLLAQFAREPVSADIQSAIRRTSALHDTINTKFDNVRSLADGVLLEFGPSRRDDLALRDRIRRWQPQLRALFLMRSASLKYRLHLPGFVVPEAAVVSLQAYDQCSAQMLENIADRMEGKAPEGRPVSAGSLALLEQLQESCRAGESRLLLSEHGSTFVPLLCQIDRLTSRLANEMKMESGSA